MSIFQKVRRRLSNAIYPETVRRFEAAGGGRRFSNIAPFANYRSETFVASSQIRPRARNLQANNPWAANGIDALVTALVGTGITPVAKIADKQARRAAQTEFRKWAKHCDAEGLTDFYGLQARAAQSLVVDGEAFIYLQQTNQGLKLQLIPAEQVGNQFASTAESVGSLAGVIGGVRFDSEGKRIAYQVRLNPLTSEISEIPASDMVHLFMPLGAGQVRGVSWLHTVLLKLNDLDALDDALLTGFKISAMHMGFLTDLNNSSGAAPYDGTQNGSDLESALEPGTLKVLPSGVDVKFNSPQQAQQSVEFASMQLRAVAAGLQMPEFLLSGDMRGANYSSMRSALISFRQRIERIQYQIIIPQFLDKVWARATFLNSEPIEVEWFPPALPWVDPLKDVEATKTEIESGLTSRRHAVARRGYDVEDLDDEIAADKAREQLLGLNFQTQPNGGIQNANPQQSN
jgi:lambda family phage portal protein